MKRGQKVRAAFVVTVAVGGTIAAGCSSEPQIIVNPPLEMRPDASTCPTAVPEHGSVCTFPAGVMCSLPGPSCPPYNASYNFMCLEGRWQVSETTCNPPPPDVLDVSTVDATDADAPDGDASDAAGGACPMVGPAVGDACARTDPAPCSYTVPCPGNLPITLQFVCARDIWQSVSGAACNPPVDGGASGDVPGGG